MRAIHFENLFLDQSIGMNETNTFQLKETNTFKLKFFMRTIHFS